MQNWDILGIQYFTENVIWLACLLLCCTNFPICGDPPEDVLKMTTQRSSWQRADFSLFLKWNDFANFLNLTDIYRWPSWNRLNSTSVGSKTVSNVAVWCCFEEKGGRVPLSLTSLQPLRTLQISIQSKYFNTSSNAIQNTRHHRLEQAACLASLESRYHSCPTNHHSKKNDPKDSAFEPT